MMRSIITRNDDDDDDDGDDDDGDDDDEEEEDDSYRKNPSMWKHCLGKNRSAAVLHAGLRILFPGALQPFGAIKPTAGVLGVHLRLVSLGTSIQSVGKGCVYSVVY